MGWGSLLEFDETVVTTLYYERKKKRIRDEKIMWAMEQSLTQESLESPASKRVEMLGKITAILPPKV